MKNQAEIFLTLHEAIAGGVKEFEKKYKVHNVSAMLNMTRTVSTGVSLALGYRRTKDGYEKLTIQK